MKTTKTTRTFLLSLATFATLVGCAGAPVITGHWVSEGVETRSGANYLNSSAAGTCGTQPFAVNVEQDTSFTGCLALGLDLKNKNVEYDIVKREGDKLYYGARPADGSGLDAPAKRPTALQVPVVLAK